MSRTIRVTGKGNLRIAPDTTRLVITLSGTRKEYQSALELSTRDTEAMKQVVEALGFERSDLKTLRFDIDPSYEDYQEDRAYRRRLVGYTYTHAMKLEFPSDRERMGRILYAVAHAPVHPDLRIQFTVADPEAARNALLEKAVADASAKARILADAAGVTLKAMQTIDYSWGRMVFETTATDSICFDRAGEIVGKTCSIDTGIEPDDIDVSDTVTIVWEMA